MSGKKVVHYSSTMYDTKITVGERAWVVPVDHPDQYNVTNGRMAHTSIVQSYDEATETFETEYSIYVPVGAKVVDSLEGLPL